MLNVIMLNVIMLNFISTTIVGQNLILFSLIMLSLIMLSLIMLSLIMLSLIMLSLMTAIMPSNVKLIVTEAAYRPPPSSSLSLVKLSLSFISLMFFPSRMKVVTEDYFHIKKTQTVVVLIETLNAEPPKFEKTFETFKNNYFINV